MQGTDPTHQTGESEMDEQELQPGGGHRFRRRLAWVATGILVFLLLVVVPPLISVNQFRRRIASNIGASLGRPVHLDRVSLTVLPVPGFTLENFVVEEDPAFGAEPVIRAATVHVAVRISSLWGRRVEFSTISLTEPSVNLVHTAKGQWNLESILLQAARIEAAPTSQKRAGPAPRFPYIEATGARINFKMGMEKTPLSLTEAEFALWLPEPGRWHLRLEAKPARTDTAPGDTGMLRVEGILGRATTLRDVPIDLHGEWLKAPLGGASILVLGRDAALRGELNLTTDLRGTAGEAAIHSTFAVGQARRADFVPAHTLSLKATCDATAGNLFHTVSGIECHFPPAGDGGFEPAVLTGSVPNVREPSTASLQLTVPGLLAPTLLDWFRVATPRLPDGLQVTGTLAGSVSYNGVAQTVGQRWSGQVVLTGGTLTAPGLGPSPMQIGELTVRAADLDPAKRSLSPASRWSAILLPVTLPLGGKDPATLEGRFDSSGYALQLTGNVTVENLLALGDAIPQLGDGLREHLDEVGEIGPPKLQERPAVSPITPLHVDLVATRIWGSPQTWSDVVAHPPARKRLRSPER
jgi:AsmA protein